MSGRSQQLQPEGLEVMRLTTEPGGLTVWAEPGSASARCPGCGRSSERVHSRFTRMVTDLPWRGIAMTLRLRVRKLFCDDSSCERMIFCERLPEVAAHARKTARLEEALLAIAFELGGRAGVRLAAELGLIVGRDALLERIKSNCRVATEALRVLSIDDFGFKRGNASGTIIVDLERHKIVDLLQGHSTELIAQWLRQRPALEVVSRDRCNVCREGIGAGAPQARQVADRWHLLHNLTQVLEEFLLTKRSALKKTAMPETGSKQKGGFRNSKDSIPTPEIPTKRPYECIERPARQRHERLVEQWKEIRRLHLAGARVKDISEWTGTSAAPSTATGSSRNLHLVPSTGGRKASSTRGCLT